MKIPADSPVDTDPDFDDDSEAAERAERLAKSFMSETAPLGDWVIRKPCLAGTTILTKARNKFVCGFTDAEIRRMFPNGADARALRRAGKAFEIDQTEMLQHLDDLWELYRIGIATMEEKRAWYFDQAAFQSAVFEFVSSGRMPPSADIEQMLADAFMLANEVAEAQVTPAPSKNKPLKKKEPRHRRSSSPTRARSRKS